MLRQTILHIFAFHVSAQYTSVYPTPLAETVECFSLLVQVISLEPAVGALLSESSMQADVPIDSLLRGPGCLTQGTFQTRVQVVFVLRCEVIKGGIVCTVQHCLRRLCKVHNFMWASTLTLLGPSTLTFLWFGLYKVIDKRFFTLFITL